MAKQFWIYVNYEDVHGPFVSAEAAFRVADRDFWGEEWVVSSSATFLDDNAVDCPEE